MGAKMYGARSAKADNDNAKPKVNENGEIPIPFDERRNPPAVEARKGFGWYCLVTAPQNEYACADALADLGTATYVPTRTFWEKRRKGKELYNTELQAPLFRGYVFAEFPRPTRFEDGTVKVSEEWNPIFERDAYGQSRLGVLRYLSTAGVPSPMPLRFLNGDKQECGIASLADDERAGWFDDRKRDFLISLQEQEKARKASEARRQASATRQAERDARAAEEAAKRALKPVWAGDVVRPIEGPFAGHDCKAENDNDDKGIVRLSQNLFGQVVITVMSVAHLENISRPYATPQAGKVSAIRRA